jgi:uncharacterized protein (DUF4415 family)
VGRTRITRREYEEAPELTEEQLDRAELAVGGKVIRPATGTLTRPRGRPRSERPTETVTLRLDAALVRALKTSGPDWRKRATKAVERLARKGA